MNQSEIKTIKIGWCQAREGTCEQVTVGFDFTSDWLRKWCAFFNQSGRVNKVNKNQGKLLSTPN